MKKSCPFSVTRYHGDEAAELPGRYRSRYGHALLTVELLPWPFAAYADRLIPIQLCWVVWC